MGDSVLIEDLLLTTECLKNDLASVVTSVLTAVLREARLHGKQLAAVLRRHGWTGTEFASPVDAERLCKDLQRLLEQAC